MRTRMAIASVAVLLVAACTSGAAPGTTTLEVPPATGSVPLEDLPGKLVTVDAVGNVVVIEPDGSGPVAVTDDAGAGNRYSQPSWSPASDLLAWSEVSDANGIGVGLSDADGGGRVTVPMSSPPFFMYWSPDGKGMGVLHNGTTGSIDFELLDIEAQEARVVDSGAPFYFSWSPASDELVVHAEGTRFATLDLEGQSTDLGATAAEYPAPHWTPAGIFHLGTGGVELRSPNGEITVLATTQWPAALVANDDGTMLAAQSLQPQGGGGVGVALVEPAPLPTNAVVVVDIGTGEVETVTQSASVGFFWSPDGESLLILEPIGGPDVRALVWRDGVSEDLGTIAPHPFFIRDVLQFFDQYAQSLDIWSPDSSAVALAGAVDGESGIWVYPTRGGDPVRVSDGSWAAWSSG